PPAWMSLRWSAGGRRPMGVTPDAQGPRMRGAEGAPRRSAQYPAFRSGTEAIIAPVNTSPPALPAARRKPHPAGSNIVPPVAQHKLARTRGATPPRAPGPSGARGGGGTAAPPNARHGGGSSGGPSPPPPPPMTVNSSAPIPETISGM